MPRWSRIDLSSLSMWFVIFCSTCACVGQTYFGTATETNFCTTQPQFCDVDELNPEGGTFSLSLVVPSNAITSATLTLSAFGDFAQGASETFDVDIEGFHLGFFLNGNPSDDLFENREFGDRGNDFESALVANANIPLALLRGFVTDGIFTATFDSSTGVNDIQGHEFFDSPVPESISYSLLFNLGQLAGDFDTDGLTDCADVDSLVEVIAAGTNDAAFDLTGDGIVDTADLEEWRIAAGAANLSSGNLYLPGDANLDGAVDASDFNIWNSNRFSQTAAWCAGDFNADGAIDASDFNLWNSHRLMSSDGLAVVPEPESLSLSFIALAWLAAHRRRG